MAMRLIATANLNSGGTTGNTGLLITDIPQSFRDLLVVVSIRSARTTFETDGVGVAINQNGTSYNYIGMGVNGASIANLNNSYESFWGGMQPSVQNSTSVFSCQEIYIPNYTSSFNKSYIQTTAAVNNISSFASQLSHTANVHSSASLPVTSLRIQSATSNGLAQYSAIWVYGIN
jgi:hypothetical protein